MILICPTCDHEVEVAEVDAGKAVACPECGNGFVVPQIAFQAPAAGGDGKTWSKKSLAKGVASAAWKHTSTEKKRKAKLWACGCMSAVLISACGLCVVVVLALSGMWDSVRENFSSDEEREVVAEKVNHGSGFKETEKSVSQPLPPTTQPEFSRVVANGVEPRADVSSNSNSPRLSEHQNGETAEGQSPNAKKVLEIRRHADRVAEVAADLALSEGTVSEQLELVEVGNDIQEGPVPGDESGWKKTGNSPIPLGYWLLGGVLVFGAILSFVFGGKCPECKKRRAIKVVSREAVSQEQIWKRLKEYDSGPGKPALGFERTMRYRNIPFIRTTYLETLRCKYCGATGQRTRVDEKRST